MAYGNGRPPMKGPLEARLTFYIAPPKKLKRKTPYVGSDLDNFCKSALDGLNGIVFDDDCQIIDLVAKKRYAINHNPCIEIELLELKELV